MFWMARSCNLENITLRSLTNIPHCINSSYYYLHLHYNMFTQTTSSDVLAQMAFWSVSGHGDLQKAFQFMIRSDNLSKSLALVLVDMSEPWTIIESLEKWTSLINSFIDSLGTDPRKLKELEEKSIVLKYTDINVHI